ncbi:YrrS family protein [Rossellomorea aquimaris]|uniref:YrrS family protein n=1 Tax=Rossellomorea aquimaris TaxID=189382 RepID=UPI001CD63A50|nr:YrrS family protein [Rossellomorea aquimaris]MCA1056238.1 YrrS family protein [Rossellomorea aquimaris]
MAKYKSRLDRRSKNNANKILNILNAVVVLLIVVVGATILTGNGSDESEKASTEVKNTEEKGTEKTAGNNKKEENDKKEDESVSMNEEETDSSEQADKEENEEEDTEKQEEEQEEKESVSLDDSKVQVEEGTEPNVEKTIVHPDWQPVGTQQSGEHVSSYDPGSPDWEEKEKALSYATGIPQDNMTVWYIEGNGGPQKSIGTVTEKGGSKAYRVYLQWNDGQGWQPTKVEVLKENDKD